MMPTKHLPLFSEQRARSMDKEDALRVRRRRFIRQLCSSTLAAGSALGMAACRTTAAASGGMPAVEFLHGVASGDPLADRVILWTRVTPLVDGDDRGVDVHWQVTSDREMQDIIVAGIASTGPERDYTVKVDAFGLAPGRTYWYRFSAGGAQSPVGRTKTLPGNDATQVRFAVFSCANYPAGYFNAYADAARRDDLDDLQAALHIGDYIYEYDVGGYASDRAEEFGRLSEPPNLLLVLADYRRRYAQYRGDRDLQALHARLPFITVWDDHEFADDAWRDGSADHQPARDGPFSLRKAAAIRAYHEWMPIRLPDPARPERIYRSFDFGRLVSLHMLDTRIIGRDQQIMMSSYLDAEGRFDESKYRADVASPHRSMMGAEQLAWLDAQVGKSKAAWQIVGQQVLMARFEYPRPVALGDLSCAEYASLRECARRDAAGLAPHDKAMLDAPTLPCYLDSWDGYPAERERLFAIMRRHDRDMVVLAGDSHNAWASDLHDAHGRHVGVEFACPSVSSPGMECSHPDEDPVDVARTMTDLIGPLYYAETSRRGYLVITATAEEVRCDWRFVDTVFSRDYRAVTGRSLSTLPGAGGQRIIEAA